MIIRNGPVVVNAQIVALLLEDVRQELATAIERHGPMASCHEGYAVILEELDELWEEVRKKSSQRDQAAMRLECIQIAAMALKFAASLPPSGEDYERAERLDTR